MCNRKVRASVITLEDTARNCFVLLYSGPHCHFGALCAGRCMPIMLRGIIKHPLNLREPSRTLLHTHKKTPHKRLILQICQKYPDLWHAICFLELEQDV